MEVLRCKQEDQAVIKISSRQATSHYGSLNYACAAIVADFEAMGRSMIEILIRVPCLFGEHA